MGRIPPRGTHVMAAVSARKAWAVTSHLMFFTATFCPMYSPWRTSGRGRRGSGLAPHLTPPHPRLSPPCCGMGGDIRGCYLGKSEAREPPAPSSHLPPNSPWPMRSPSVRCCRFSNQPAGHGHKGRLAGATGGATLPCPQNPDHNPLPPSPTFGQLLLSRLHPGFRFGLHQLGADGSLLLHVVLPGDGQAEAMPPLAPRLGVWSRETATGFAMGPPHHHPPPRSPSSSGSVQRPACPRAAIRSPRLSPAPLRLDPGR